LEGNRFEVEALKELEGYEAYLDRVQQADRKMQKSGSKSNYF
jgi:hypothetical protein